MDSQTSAPSYRLGFIGGGKLAGSVIRGLVRAKYCAPGLILVSEPNEATRRILEHELGVTGTADNAEIAEKSEGICPAHSANVSAISAVKGFALDCHAGINSNAG